MSDSTEISRRASIRPGFPYKFSGYTFVHISVIYNPLMRNVPNWSDTI